MYFRRHFFIPFLIGRDIPDHHTQPQPLTEVLREANEKESDPKFGSDGILRRHETGRLNKGSINCVFAYFGSTDPAHVEAIEDIVNDLHHRDTVLVSSDCSDDGDEDQD